jgi:quercetin dioxygenase-like cupin family protein
MNLTTYLKKRPAMPRLPLENCHGGRGALDWTVVLGEQEASQGGVRFVHDDILPPGVSIGTHRHTEDIEYYYILSGRGTMTLDQEQYEVAEGDISVVFPGGSHGLENTGTADLRILVFSISK